MKLGILGVNPITQMILENISDKNNEMYLFDDDKEKIGKKFMGLDIVDNCYSIKSFYKDGKIDSAVVSFGEKYLVKKKELSEELKKMGISFPNFIHESCLISSSAKIDIGIVMGRGVIIGFNTIINNYSVFWSGSIIEHDSCIGKSCYIGPNVTISGFTEVGDCTLIGSGAVVLPEVKIGKQCIIGAGSVVTKNVPDYSKVAGSPAKILL